MTIREIVRAYLETNGYDGLDNPSQHCYCRTDGLIPKAICWKDLRWCRAWTRPDKCEEPRP